MTRIPTFFSKVRAPLIAGLVAFGALMASPANAYVAETVSPLNVRSGPSVKYRRISTLARLEVVNVKKCLSTNWCQIQFRGRIGWVSGKYLVNVRNVAPTVIVPSAPEVVIIEPEEPATIVIEEHEDIVILEDPDEITIIDEEVTVIEDDYDTTIIEEDITIIDEDVSIVDDDYDTTIIEEDVAIIDDSSDFIEFED